MDILWGIAGIFVNGAQSFISAEYIFLNCSWNLDQLLDPSCISFLTRAL